jgi:MFS family permease
MRWWAAANAVSNIGTWMQLIAQNLLVLELTGSVAMTGLSLSAQAAPGLLFGMIGGAVVDKWPHRLVAGAGQIGLAVVAFATAALAALGMLSVPLLLMLGAVSGLIATMDGPASSLLGNALVPEDEVPSAIALGSIVSSVGRLVGTAMAGATVALVGIPAAYLANGLSFLAVAGCLPFLREAPRPPADPDVVVAPAGAATDAGGVLAALHFLLAHRSLVPLLAVGAIAGVLGRNYSMSLAALVTGPLEGGPGAYGAVGVALAVGGIGGALAAGRLDRPRTGVVLAAAAAAAVLQVLAGLSPLLLVLVVLAVPMAAAEAAAETATASMLQTVPPERMRGRVLGAWRTASTGWGLAGPPALGLLLEAAGVRAGLVIGGVVVLVAIAAIAVLRPDGTPLRTRLAALLRRPEPAYG